MRLCLRCKLPVNKPYRYHKRCKELEDAELREKIEAIPEKPMTEEVWKRMWETEPTPFERQHG